MPTDGRGREEPVVDITTNGRSAVVRLVGELDLYNADVVRKALLDCVESRPERVVVDLTEVEFIDSTALGVLIEARAHLPRREAFLLAAAPLETKRALQVSGLDRHFAVHETVEEALAAPL